MNRRILWMVLLLMVALNIIAQDEVFEIRGHIENVTDYTQLPSNGVLRKVGSTATAPLTCIGSPRVPVILVQFADLFFTVGENDEENNQAYQAFFNAEKGVSPGNSYCSVREYFRDQSDTQFSPDFDVIGPVTLSRSYTYYGEDRGRSKDIHINDFYSEACQLAVQKDVDWTQYDNDGNGMVDFVFFIYAGQGQNQKGVESEFIWPKETVSTIEVKNEGRSIVFGASGCTNELFKANMDGIGACVHEMCHGLGLPDFYDYDEKEYGMDYWDLMDSGCYKNNGRLPVGLSAYELDFLGWRELVELDPESAYSLTIAPLEKGGVGYKVVNKANPDEYFILENRQNIGMDKYIGYSVSSYYNALGANHGLMISHVNFDQVLWNSNKVNTKVRATDVDFQHMTIVPADGELISSFIHKDNTWAKSQHGDLYPGENNVTEMTSYAVFTGGTLGQTINNIVEHEDGTITVDINGGTTVEEPEEPEKPEEPEDPEVPEEPEDPEVPEEPLVEPDIPEIV